MSTTFVESRTVKVGHEVLRSSGVVICYLRGSRFGKPVADDRQHRCPFCSALVYTYA